MNVNSHLHLRSRLALLPGQPGSLLLSLLHFRVKFLTAKVVVIFSQQMSNFFLLFLLTIKASRNCGWLFKVCKNNFWCGVCQLSNREGFPLTRAKIPDLVSFSTKYSPLLQEKTNIEIQVLRQELREEHDKVRRLQSQLSTNVGLLYANNLHHL